MLFEWEEIGSPSEAAMEGGKAGFEGTLKFQPWPRKEKIRSRTQDRRVRRGVG